MPSKSENIITEDNCGPNWPPQHNPEDVPGLAKCRSEEDKDADYPCTSTRNMNWFLNTLNECFAQPNVIVNQNNFLDVLQNSHLYKGTSTGKIIVGILLASLTTTLLTPIPPKPQLAIPMLQTSGVRLSTLFDDPLKGNIINSIKREQNKSTLQKLPDKKNEKILKRHKRQEDCLSARVQYEGNQIHLKVCHETPFERSLFF